MTNEILEAGNKIKSDIALVDSVQYVLADSALDTPLKKMEAALQQFTILYGTLQSEEAKTSLDVVITDFIDAVSDDLTDTKTNLEAEFTELGDPTNP